MRSKTKSLASVFFLIFLFLSPCLNAQWLKQNFPTNDRLMRVRFADEMVGWILGFDYIYNTQDGGLSWMPQDSSLGYGEALYVLNDKTVFYSNYTGSFANWQRGIRRTTDGGLSWETVDSLPFFYTDFEFLNDQTGFAIGIDNNNITSIRKTIDGGSTWITISTNFLQTGFELQGITFVNAQEGWTVSYDGYIYHTVNGGTNWMLQDSLRSGESWFPVRDIFFINPDSGWAVGGISGAMLIARTVNGGNSWIQNIQSGSSLREVTFINSTVGWFVGSVNSNIFVAKTTNGGIDWQNQNLIPPLTGVGIESISMINKNTGWIVGWSGEVYKTTTGGMVAINEDPLGNELPEKFILEQNYPNPFNPTTSIRYRLQRSNHITLDVYNITGQKVATLVNKLQVAGTYEVIFRAEDLPVGLYFYKITSGSSSLAKKMLLVK
jgi:photosystem II stability/assembly factor-like uncharacterized protein